MYIINNIGYFYIVVCVCVCVCLYVAVLVMADAFVVLTFVISSVNFVPLMAATLYWLEKSDWLHDRI